VRLAIGFIVILAVVYFGFKLLRLEKLDLEDEEDEEKKK
jgi:hypothetical protein